MFSKPTLPRGFFIVATATAALAGSAAPSTTDTLSAHTTATTAITTTSTPTAHTTTSTTHAAPTTSTTHAAPATTSTRPRRPTFDQIGPNDDATTQPYSEVTAVSTNPARDARLASAATTDNFRETTTSFVFYKNLTPGDESDPGEGRSFTSTHKTHPGAYGRQPAGPLTGRVIYCSAGHGWTNDNTSTSLWYTQRPDTHGVVEDFGNLDQMNLYADVCFRAGATIVPLRPIGFQHVERIIDNESSHAAFYGAWADSKSTASFGYAGATVPYRYARASAEETAVARFRPVIPVTDEYPVYTWARAGADRVTQTYRIVYAGGVTEVDVDHRRVGNGWVYLGTYTFRAGNDGYVEVIDKVRDATSVAAQGVVIADAIRFGNGMGDVNRGGGISGHPREEEASRYWVERSLPAGAPPIFNAFENREDQSNNVGSAPRFAAYMNRESNGAFFDRLFMSFHSNAVGGRGVVGLYNSHAIMRPDHQIELAKLAADELNKEMTSAGLKLLRPWNVRPVRTDGHINFGEIRRDYINNEMSATILEVAFHDNPDDAALLRQLSVRRAVAQSAYRATLRFFHEVGGENLNTFSPPDPPRLVSVAAGPTSGTIVASWQPATQDPLSSQAEEITYRVYTSADGVAFDTGTDVGAKTTHQFAKISKNSPLYVRVTAVSPGGESRPSTVLGASLGTRAPVLIVQGAPTESDDLAVTQTAARSLGSALRGGGSFARLVPRVMNNGEQVRAVGLGLRTISAGFDSIDAAAVGQLDSFMKYRAISAMLGRSPVPATLTTSDTLARLHDYVTSGGRVLISGGCLAETAPGTTESLTRWGTFCDQVLQIRFGDQTSVTQLLQAGDRDLTTVTLQIGNRNLRYFEPRPTEVLVPEKEGRAVLAYDHEPGAASVATLKDRAICTAVLGFPLEELEGRDDQAVLAAQFFIAMGLTAEKPPAKPSTKSKGDIEDDPATTATATTAPADKKTTPGIIIEDSRGKPDSKKTASK